MNNNRNPDPVELAHRVLGADKVGRDLNNAASWDAIDLVLENAPALAHAVIAVAELHEPDHTYPDRPKCIHCSEMASSGTRRIAVLWPCETVEAITTALDAIK